MEQPPLVAAPVEIVRIVPPPKAGWRTTEFWVTVTTLGVAVAEHVPGPWGWLTMAIATAAYNISRGWAKR
jgi:hypothetical protein